MSTQPSVYADTAGAAQPLPGLIESVCHQLLSTQLANPHSRNAASRATTEMVDNVRHRILQHLNTNRDEYSVIFTASSTASLKLLAESFQFATNDYVTTNSAYYADADLIDDGSDKDKPASFTLDESARLPMIPKFAYLQDNHTSVLGMRDIVKKQHVQVLCVKDEQQINRLVISKPKEGTPERTRENCSLFVYPAQSNFNGRKYPMEWTERIRHLTSGCEDYYICVDAAGQVGTSPLDLSTYKPDFVTMSFYKMFGFPTGVGALLVHKSAQPRMAKTYFGGGAVDVSLPTANMHKLRETFHERYEDGTLNYHGIMAVGLGLEKLQKLGGIQTVQNHTLAITNYAIQLLSALKHHNDKPVLKVYSKDMSDYTRPDNQGPIINFNIIKDDGSFVGYTEVEKMAEMYNIELRTGCFCNQGACMLYLEITQKQVMDNFKSGKKCGDEVDMIDGMPVGSVRISFGAQSTAADVQRIAAMIYDCFVVRSPLPFDAIVGKVQQPKTVLTQALTKNLKPVNGKMMNGKTNGLSNGHSNGYNGVNGVHGVNGVNGQDVINGMELNIARKI